MPNPRCSTCRRPRTGGGRLVHDHARADEDQHALDRGREVLDLRVAVLVLGVRGLVRLAQRQVGDDRGEQVDARVHRLGDDRDRSRDRARDDLQRRSGSSSRRPTAAPRRTWSCPDGVGGDQGRVSTRARPALSPVRRGRCRRSQARGAASRQGAHGAATVADRVLLLRATAPPSCARRRRGRPGRTPGRNRILRRRGATRSTGPRSAPRTPAFVPSGLDERDRAHVGRLAILLGRASRRAACCRFCSSVAPSPAKRAERTPGRAVERGHHDPGVVGDRRDARGRGGGVGLAARRSPRRTRPVSGGSSTQYGSGTRECADSIPPSSRSLWGLRVAITIRKAAPIVRKRVARPGRSGAWTAVRCAAAQLGDALSRRAPAGRPAKRARTAPPRRSPAPRPARRRRS